MSGFLRRGALAAAFLLVLGAAASAAEQKHGGHGAAPKGHTHAAKGHAQGAKGHTHGVIALPAGAAAPRVAATVAEAPLSGWNLRVELANFRFAPENASRAHVAGEGHGHLYVDGVKRARLYGEWFHVGGLQPGRHVLTVTLNSNDHNAFAVAGKPVAATVELDVPGDGAAAAAKVFPLTIVDGAVAGRDTLRVTEGDHVKLVWLAAAPAELHLHGLDVTTKVAAGEPAAMAFHAHRAGRYPVTVHGAGGHHGKLLYVEVHPR